MRLAGITARSDAARPALAASDEYLHGQLDLRPATRRNDESDLRQVAGDDFALARVTFPTLTVYRAHLQALGLCPATGRDLRQVVAVH